MEPCIGTCQVKLFQSGFNGITPQNNLLLAHSKNVEKDRRIEENNVK